MANVIATPHVAAFSREAIHRETHWAVEDVARVLAGSEPLHWRPEQEGNL
jgi:phosphoglycerate dehydrogenase-like enzyme